MNEEKKVKIDREIEELIAKAKETATSDFHKEAIDEYEEFEKRLAEEERRIADTEEKGKCRSGKEVYIDTTRKQFACYREIHSVGKNFFIGPLTRSSEFRDPEKKYDEDKIFYLEEYKIGAILYVGDNDVSTDTKDEYSRMGIRYKFVEFKTPDYKESVDIKTIYSKCKGFINQQKNSSKNVLITSIRGDNRAPAILLMRLINSASKKREKPDLVDLIVHIYEKRPVLYFSGEVYNALRNYAEEKGIQIGAEEIIKNVVASNEYFTPT
jgi:hypothetical protein